MTVDIVKIRSATVSKIQNGDQMLVLREDATKDHLIPHRLPATILNSGNITDTLRLRNSGNPASGGVGAQKGFANADEALDPRMVYIASHAESGVAYWRCLQPEYNPNLINLYWNLSPLLTDATTTFPEYAIARKSGTINARIYRTTSAATVRYTAETDGLAFGLPQPGNTVWLLFAVPESGFNAIFPKWVVGHSQSVIGNEGIKATDNPPISAPAGTYAIRIGYISKPINPAQAIYQIVFNFEAANGLFQY